LSFSAKNKDINIEENFLITQVRPFSNSAQACFQNTADNFVSVVPPGSGLPDKIVFPENG